MNQTLRRLYPEEYPDTADKAKAALLEYAFVFDTRMTQAEEAYLDGLMKFIEERSNG